VLRLELRAVRLRERQLGSTPDSRRQAFLGLAAAVMRENLDRPRVELHGPPSSSRLGFRQVKLVSINLDEGPADCDSTAGQVDVVPPKAKHFASAHARSAQDHPHGDEPIGRH
jgi:hypothetical protein